MGLTLKQVVGKQLELVFAMPTRTGELKTCGVISGLWSGANSFPEAEQNDLNGCTLLRNEGNFIFELMNVFVLQWS